MVVLIGSEIFFMIINCKKDCFSVCRLVKMIFDIFLALLFILLGNNLFVLILKIMGSSQEKVTFKNLLVNFGLTTVINLQTILT